MKLTLLPGTFSVCRLASDSAIPDWATGGRFWQICRTADELSVVCEEHLPPAGVRAEPGWQALQCEGPLDFAMTGILASVAQPLAVAGISIFAISTFDTDYILVKREQTEQTIRVLRNAGHQVASNGIEPNPQTD